MDLSGLWYRAPHHGLELYVGYGRRDWEVRLLGRNLLARQNEMPGAIYSGKATSDLLEPEIEMSEIRLVGEFRL